MPIRLTDLVKGPIRLTDIPGYSAPEEDARTETERMSPGRFLQGGGEAALTALTGGPATAVAGVRGLASIAGGLASGRGDINERAAEVIRRTQESLTYHPRGQTGQDLLAKIAAPFEYYSRNVSQRAGKGVADFTHSPAAGAATETALEFAPSLINLRRAPKALSDISKTTSAAKEAGINLRLHRSLGKVEKDFHTAAEKATGGNRELGANMPALQSAISEKRKAAKTIVDDLYEDARATKAGVSAKSLKRFSGDVASKLDGFDVETMPIVRRRMAELNRIDELPDQSVVKLDAIESYRKRLNKNRPAATDTSQAAALNTMRGALDEFLDAQFNADMISGSPKAIEKWKAARSANAHYRSLFSDEKLIKQLQVKSATPEEMRAWIFGASAAGMRKEAARTVGKVKEILGEGHPQFNALRQEALLDIMQPLMNDKPDFKQFMANYDALVRKNPTVAKELFPDSLTSLQELRALAASAEKAAPTRHLIDLDRVGATALFGHGIAKAGLKVNLAKKVFNALRLGGTKSVKRQILSDILGYDAYAAVVPKSAVIVGGGAAALMNREGEGTIER